MILEFLYFDVARILADDKNFERRQKTFNKNLEREKWRVTFPIFCSNREQM